MKPDKVCRSVIFPAAGLLLASCLLGPQSKRGSVVDNEMRVGTIYAAGGTPAVNARVRVFPVGHVPDTLADTGSAPQAGQYFATRTDEDGNYTLGALQDGEYNILAELSGNYSYQDSVFIEEKTGRLRSDTLDDPGSIIGVVGLQPNHNPLSVTVQVLGTNSYTNADSEGRFRLDALAEGKYTLRIISGFSDYEPLYKSVTVESGIRDTLPDTLWLPFLGIPVVQGVLAEFDTLNSVVRLSWDSVAFREFGEYLVYRDLSPGLNLSTIPIGQTTGTRYLDSLKDDQGRPLLDSNTVSAPSFEYRIRIRNKSDDIGLSYGKVKIQTPPPGQVRTDIGFRIVKMEWDSARQIDSVEVQVTLGNPSRKLESLSWRVGNDTDNAHEESLDRYLEIEKTLRFGSNREGLYDLTVSVKDDAGTIWTKALPIAGNSSPMLSGIPDSVAFGYSAYSFRPAAVDVDGDQLRFAISNAPAWTVFDTLTGLLSGAPRNEDSAIYRDIIISVSDGRRTRELKAFAIKVQASPWIPGAGVPGEPTSAQRSFAATVGNKIYLLDDSVRSYDPKLRNWAFESLFPGPDSLDFIFAAALEEKILVVMSKGWLPGERTYPVFTYEPLAKVWTEVAPFPGSYPVHPAGGASLNGIFYVIGSGKVWAYDPASDTWTAKTPMPSSLKGESSSFDKLYRPRAVVVNQKILVMGHEDQERLIFSNAGIVGIYDPASDTWSQAESVLPRLWSGIGAIEGKVYVAGGYTETGYTDLMQEFDIATGTWRERRRLPLILGNMAYSVFDGKLYLFKGQSIENGAVTDAVWEYDPSLDP